MEVTATVDIKWNYAGIRMWKYVSRVEISWNLNGTRVEVDFYSGNRMEVCI